jgi:hypothetical protein
MLEEKLRVSKLRFFSVGTVAANKDIGSFDIEVIPDEELPFLDGEISSNQEKIEISGTDSSGAAYKSSIITSNSIKATWLKLSVSNRLTAPDVRRNEKVMIYQFGDEPTYYWTTLKDDTKFRRLETVVYGISATPNEDDKLDNTNMYWFEMSSHTKQITLQTSKANGEPFAYSLQINTKDGAIVIMDDGGNWIRLDSVAKRIEAMNADGSHFDMFARNLTVSIPDTTAILCKDFVVHASNSVAISAGQGCSMNAGSSWSAAAPNASVSGSGSASVTGGSVSVEGSGSLNLTSPATSIS